ncbi:peptidylprolyl isomerase [Thiosulfativibrio zosterae]|uniref:Peptidyl-prolyl cis-trans isomerase n=1 Tax=Thiosulfativibrio zosterae TaxID=2675053 RepID=A0A6F8PNX6_9GAMM|nr:peptidylprolyl isomerase [Thiosulfativibrio zosterae]BBP43822.1 peptidyl-prolyl cis-trans isomerase [Thiosulfativibrio zosterae]
MLKNLLIMFQTTLLCLGLTSQAIAQSDEPATGNNPMVLMETSMGNIMIELYPDKAPESVKNFLRYVNEGFYDGTIFHRVIPNFMVQGGGFNKDMQKKMTHAPITNEADNGLRNEIGTLAMARTNDPQSATAQFFINVAQNSFLDFREKTPRAWGYAVFGRVTQGMKVVNSIRNVKTGFKNGMGDVPVDTVEIIKARQIK